MVLAPPARELSTHTLCGFTLRVCCVACSPSGPLLMAPPIDANRPFPSTPPVYPLVKMWLEPLWHTTFLPHRHTTFLPVQPGRVPITVSPPQIPPPPPSGFVGVLTSVPVALVIKRAGHTHAHPQTFNHGGATRQNRCAACHRPHGPRSRPRPPP